MAIESSDYSIQDLHEIIKETNTLDSLARNDFRNTVLRVMASKVALEHINEKISDAKKNNLGEIMGNAKAYWKFMLSKAFRTGLQSAISLWLANSSGIIDADVFQLVGVAFLTSFITVIQHALEQYKPKATYED